MMAYSVPGGFEANAQGQIVKARTFKEKIEDRIKYHSEELESATKALAFLKDNDGVEEIIKQMYKMGN